jgi:outer membrane receptor protein involved in Fe transport
MAFGRRAHRVPTFNELYYVGYGNPDLKPEDAWLTDIGLDFERSVGDSWSIRAKANAFYNRLTNKITSAPTPEDPAIWQPYNIGKVRSTGIDLTGGFTHEGTAVCSFDAKYSYQSALDITPDSYTFGTQIPYIARHTIILNGSLGWKRWELHPLWQLRAGRRDGTGDLPAWNTLDLVLSKSVALGKSGSLKLKLAAGNIMDCRYETVSGYPMPGRNFIGGVEYKF